LAHPVLCGSCMNFPAAFWVSVKVMFAPSGCAPHSCAEIAIPGPPTATTLTCAAIRFLHGRQPSGRFMHLTIGSPNTVWRQPTLQTYPWHTSRFSRNHSSTTNLPNQTSKLTSMLTARPCLPATKLMPNPSSLPASQQFPSPKLHASSSLGRMHTKT